MASLGSRQEVKQSADERFVRHIEVVTLMNRDFYFTDEQVESLNKLIALERPLFIVST